MTTIVQTAKGKFDATAAGFWNGAKHFLFLLLVGVGSAAVEALVSILRNHQYTTDYATLAALGTVSLLGGASVWLKQEYAQLNGGEVQKAVEKTEAVTVVGPIA